MDNYKIIKFKENKFEMEINVSPEEDTVCLTQEQISRLFERDKTVITRHINYIFWDKESTSAKNASVDKVLTAIKLLEGINPNNLINYIINKKIY